MHKMSANNHLIPNNFGATLLLLLSIVHTVDAVYYCYEVVRLRDRPLASNDCAPPLLYESTVQLCCAQQQVPGAMLQQTYEQLPQPGSPDAIPDRCERGLHFPSGETRCRNGLTLRVVAGGGGGAGALQQSNNNLCCPPDVALPNELSGFHAPVSVLGMVNGQIVGLRTVCAPNQQRITTASGVVCTDQQTVWDPQRMCCAFTQANSQLTGVGGRPGTCADLAVPGRPSDCPGMKEFCENPLYRDLMTQQCPRTCNRCGQRVGTLGAQFANVGNGTAMGGTCVDRIGPTGKSDCPDREAYCRMPLYRTLMMEECPFTCKFCGLRLPNANGTRIGPAAIPPGNNINVPPGLQIDQGQGPQPNPPAAPPAIFPNKK